MMQCNFIFVSLSLDVPAEEKGKCVSGVLSECLCLKLKDYNISGDPKTRGGGLKIISLHHNCLTATHMEEKNITLHDFPYPGRHHHSIPLEYNDKALRRA